MDTPFHPTIINTIILNAMIKKRELILHIAEKSQENQGELNNFAYIEANIINDWLKTLEMIQAGQYGICLDCGEPIPLQRLTAKLSALRCLACQKEWEKQHG